MLEGHTCCGKKEKEQVIAAVVEVAKQVALLNMVVSGSCIRTVSKLRK